MRADRAKGMGFVDLAIRYNIHNVARVQKILGELADLSRYAGTKITATDGTVFSVVVNRDHSRIAYINLEATKICDRLFTSFEELLQEFDSTEPKIASISPINDAWNEHKSREPIEKTEPTQRMKLVCSCGNEMEFDPIDEDTGEEREEDEFGQYVTKDIYKFEFWAAHDQAGMTCEKCKKSIWYFA